MQRIEELESRIKELEEQLSVCQPMKVCDICWDRKDELIRIYSRALLDIFKQNFDQGACNLNREDCSNNCTLCFKKIAQEALYGKKDEIRSNSK